MSFALYIKSFYVHKNEFQPQKSLLINVIRELQQEGFFIIDNTEVNTQNINNIIYFNDVCINNCYFYFQIF